MPAFRHSLRSLSLALAVMATMGTCTPSSLSACTQYQLSIVSMHEKQTKRSKG